MSKYVGIDYGLGTANKDPKTGHRYGVIKINSLHEFIWDSLESEYGEPTCPECGSKVEDSSHGKDYFCESCAEKDGLLDENGEYNPEDGEGLRGPTYWSDQVFSDEPIGFTFNEDGYESHSAFDGSCLFVTESPFYTFAGFCSPCAPGAGDLDNANLDGVKTLCFGHEMFNDDKAPYPVYRVSDNSLVEPV